MKINRKPTNDALNPCPLLSTETIENVPQIHRSPFAALPVDFSEPHRNYRAYARADSAGRGPNV